MEQMNGDVPLVTMDQALVVVAWPEGIHHVLALPQDQQSVRQVGQGQNKEPSEHADGTEQQDGHISKFDCKDIRGQIGQRVGEHLESRHKVFHQVEFWERFTHPAYTDLDLIMQDDRLPVNRASLVALSPNLSELLNPSIDALILENVCRQDFLDMVALFYTAEEDVLLTPAVQDLVRLLEVTIFQTSSTFASSLHQKARKPTDTVFVQKSLQHDAFLPGYSGVKKVLESVGLSTSTSDPAHPEQEVKIEEKLKEDRNSKTNYDDKDSDDEFIDDKEASEEEDWSEEDDSPPKKQGKPRGRKTTSSIVKKWNEWAELLVTDDDVSDRGDPQPSLDVVVKDWLKCHHCHQVGYTGMEDLISHLRGVHQCNHQLHHCAFCDLPFTEKSKCIKHEQQGCQNTFHTCYKCGKQCQDRTALLEHLLAEHGVGVRRKCPHCEKSFLTIMPLGMLRWPHVERCLGKGSKVCSRLPLGRHKRVKGGTSGDKECDDCGGTYRDAWKHRRQCTALHHDIKYVCNMCKKGFRRLGAVKKHFKLFEKCKQQKDNQVEYQKLMKYVEKDVKGRTVCQDCGCEYVTRKGPLEHRKNCSAFTQFKCFACNRGMNAMDGFHIHFSKFPACRAAAVNAEIVAEIVARSQKPEFHVCYLCGAQYKAKESIEKHMLSHSETVEYFVCRQQDCGKKFVTQKNLDMHLKNHTMPKVICSICGKQVKQGSMPLHMILHTGKKIECPICGKLFQHKGVLNKHIRTIHDEKKTKSQKEKRKRTGKKSTLRPDDGKEESRLVHQQQPLQTIQVQLEGSESGHTVRVSLPGDLVGQVGQQQSEGLAVVQAGCYPQGPILMPGPIVGGVQQFLTLHQPRYQTQ